MFNFKRLTALVLLFAVCYSIFTPPLVYAANGWDETTHSRDVTCKQCGGRGEYNYVGGCLGGNCTYYWRKCENGDSCPDPTHSKDHRITCGQPLVPPPNNPNLARWCPVHEWAATQGGYGKCDYFLYWADVDYYWGCPKNCIRETCSCNRTQKEYDNTLPTLSTSKSLDAQDPTYLGQPVTVTCTATDNLSGVSMYEFSFS